MSQLFLVTILCYTLRLFTISLASVDNVLCNKSTVISFIFTLRVIPILFLFLDCLYFGPLFFHMFSNGISLFGRKNWRSRNAQNSRRCARSGRNSGKKPRMHFCSETCLVRNPRRKEGVRRARQNTYRTLVVMQGLAVAQIVNLERSQGNVGAGNCYIILHKQSFFYFFYLKSPHPLFLGYLSIAHIHNPFCVIYQQPTTTDLSGLFQEPNGLQLVIY